MKALSLSLILLLTACSSTNNGSTGSEPPLSPVRIQTSEGPVLGVRLAENGVRVFRGLPFAQAPLGPLRWQPPKKLSPRAQLLTADSFGPACMQGPHTEEWYRQVIAAFGEDPAQFKTAEQVSEDCLYLNIWLPESPAKSPLPVMVWIHGGSYKGGWAYEPDYLGAALAERDVVVVSIGYRLGAFGYLAPRGAAKNTGLLDQIAALEWLNRNIGEFGGDKSNITIMGESAGAASVTALLGSPLARGLFHRAIHQSGGFEFLEDQTEETHDAAYRALQETRKTPLLGLPASAVQTLAEKNLGQHSFTPIVDGKSLTLSFADLLKNNQFSKVDLLLGSNKDEYRMYIDRTNIDSQLEALRERIGRAPVDALVQEHGPLSALDRLSTAEQMRCPGYALAERNGQSRGRNGQSGGRSYVYLFDKIRDGNKAEEFGAYHGAEIPYVFGTHARWLPTNAHDLALSKAMMRAWVNFARNGSPGSVAGQHWPEFKGTHVMRLGQTVALSTALDHTLCKAFATNN